MAYALFRWQSLPRIPRRALPAIQALHQLVYAHAHPPRTVEPLTTLLREPVSGSIEPARFSPLAHQRSSPSSVSVLLRDSESLAPVLVELEGELASYLCRAILGRPPRVIDHFQPPPESVEGAVAALLLASSRECSGRILLLAAGQQAVSAFHSATAAGVVFCDGVVAVGPSRFRFRVCIPASTAPLAATARFSLSRLKHMGAVAVSLPVIAARFCLPSHEVCSLEVGDAVMPGDGWLVRPNSNGLEGLVQLATCGCSLALLAELHSDGRLVLGEKLMTIADYAPVERSEDAEEPTIADAIAQAPLVVQVEIGHVSFAASRWAELKPGDIVSTGLPIGERVVLRVAGCEVAVGDLVDIDGELGVRIRSFSSRKE